ncbi:hypothetical protein NECAME_06245 [Necator americanus]|uniref:Uncharacterized protein n=1 Tax=Necator americanus TaxID=51031 RepID=W2TXG5_NECAM|nr:hypothetical protein NECAME_06245 [Necator americanus]ETN85732.1 hypothetical protein NECAME_06245 [Necator americanus]
MRRRLKRTYEDYIETFPEEFMSLPSKFGDYPALHQFLGMSNLTFVYPHFLRRHNPRKYFTSVR